MELDGKFEPYWKTIIILQVNKGNCMVVLDDWEYKQNPGSINPSLMLLLREKL
jgi:hypothetical protein